MQAKGPATEVAQPTLGALGCGQLPAEVDAVLFHLQFPRRGGRSFGGRCLAPQNAVVLARGDEVTGTACVTRLACARGSVHRDHSVMVTVRVAAGHEEKPEFTTPSNTMATGL